METRDDLNQLVQELYRVAYSSPISEFKQKCFELIAPVILFDSGTWITRCEHEIPFYEADSFTYNLPDGFMDYYHQLSDVSTQVHQVFGVMLGNMGKTLDILDVVPQDEWYGSDMYQLYCEKFNLHHSLMTVWMNSVNQAIHVITFARHEKAAPFTQEDKLAKQFLVPNLVEALRVNILNSFKHGVGGENSYRAVSDRYGNLFEAEEGFIAKATELGLLKERAISVELLDSGVSWHNEQHQLYSQNFNGLMYLELNTSSLSELMSPRKLQLCQYLVEGKSNKEMAKVLDLSPDTVSNHLKEIFKLLNVTSRHQAIAYLIRQNLTLEM